MSRGSSPCSRPGPGIPSCREARSKIGKVGAHHLGGGNIGTVAMAPDSSSVPSKTARFHSPGRTGWHGPYARRRQRPPQSAVDSGRDRLSGMAKVDHVMEHQPAIGMHTVNQPDTAPSEVMTMGT